jgi:hypothetical protein
MPSRQLELIQEWSDFMKTSIAGNDRTLVGKILIGVVFAVMIGNVEVAPALGKDNPTQNHDNGYYENSGHLYARYDNRGHGYGRGYVNRGRVYNHGRYVNMHGRRVYQPYGYRGRVYAPPPVVYAPPAAPGISIFLPPLFIPPLIIPPVVIRP